MKINPAKNILTIILMMLFVLKGIAQNSFENEKISIKPQIHFTPPYNWMNDPNGLFYIDGTYHLFYQFNPKSNKWGPMHWGHATSNDLTHWNDQPIALYPDDLGTIFSGSVVVDYQNTSGLKEGENPPIIAIYTSTNHKREYAGAIDFQNQSIAYSNDLGMTWLKYSANPVLTNPGIKDFRDPKVIWYEKGQKWIMSLAVKDKISFYSSKNLIDWNFESDFGKNIGYHGGVWECPDLFPIVANDGELKWVLLISLNPGGFQPGSGTQYFVGTFDGTNFIPDSKKSFYVDLGPDNYAGVTFSNVPNNKTLALSWMNNWDYAQEIPTKGWRSLMSLPKKLSLIKEGNQYLLKQQIDDLIYINFESTNIVDESYFKLHSSPYIINWDRILQEHFEVKLMNQLGEEIKFTFSDNKLLVDRSNSGDTDFSSKFSTMHEILIDEQIKSLEIVYDYYSVELFINDGMKIISELVFPSSELREIKSSIEIMPKVYNLISDN